MRLRTHPARLNPSAPLVLNRQPRSARPGYPCQPIHSDESTAAGRITKVAPLIDHEVRASAIAFAALPNDRVAPPIELNVAVLRDRETKEDDERSDGNLRSSACVGRLPEECTHTTGEGSSDNVVELAPESRVALADKLEREEDDIDIANKVAL